MIGRRIILSGALVLLMGAAASGADDPAQGRVGGIEVAEGEVALRLLASGGAAGAARPGAWSEAGRNDPVASGMSVRTAAASRAVLRAGGDLVAVSDGSEADIVKLDDAGTTIALRRGRLGVRLSERDAGREIEIIIPSGALRLSAPGEYDIIAGDGKSPARVAVPAGTAQFSGKRLDAVVASGGAVLLNGSDPVTILPGSTDDDAFGEWWRAQKRVPADAPVLRHVSVAVTGHELLDGHGAWERVAGLGAAWFPKDLPRDWVPYRYGRWRWMNPWGWTWIDDMPWGFATSHFGRWANVGRSDGEAGRWGWVPGERPGEQQGKRIEEPAFMPAAVAFLGTAGVGLSYPDAFSPAVAWFPLAPGELYWPSFTDDPDAIRRLNTGAVADPSVIGPARKDDPPADVVTGEYRNRRYASVVPRPVFVGGKPVADAVIELPARRLENAPLLAGSPGIEPQATTPPSRAVADRAERGVAANLAKAGDTLARIIKWREQRKRPVETAVSRTPVANAPAVETRNARLRALIGKKHGTARAHPAAARARSAAPAKMRLRKAERSGKPATSRAAELRRTDAGGG
jgi:hypothetical protein